MPSSLQQDEFMDSQIVMLTRNATLQRGKDEGKVYLDEKEWKANFEKQQANLDEKGWKANFEKQKDSFRQDLGKELKFFREKYTTARVREKEHEKNIEDLAANITKAHGSCLQNQRFRIGRAQKALNLFLKYSWCLGKIPEPPQFPIDRIMLGKILKLKSKGIAWTKLDDIEEYREIMKEAKEDAKERGLTLAKWELDVYNKYVLTKLSSGR